MADREYLDLVAFLDQGEGKKKRRVTLGYAYVNDRGQTSMKFETIPVRGWDGSVLVQERQQRQQGQGYGGQPAQQQSAPQGRGHDVGSDYGEDIPF